MSAAPAVKPARGGAVQRSAGSPLQRPWSRKSDSNRRPVLYKGTALPTELNRHICRAFARLCTRGRTPRGPAATLAVLSNFCGLAMRALLQCLVGGCAIALTVWFGGAPPFQSRRKTNATNKTSRLTSPRVLSPSRRSKALSAYSRDGVKPQQTGC